jgi:membrane peptidoglycan carboxypeptidase
MTYLYTLIGDAMMLASLSWFAGYGGTGPITGIRLTLKAKLRLFAEVFAITIALLYLFIEIDQALGWATHAPWPGSPAPHRLIAIGVLLTAGFLHARRRARAWQQALPESVPKPLPEPVPEPAPEPEATAQARAASASESSSAESSSTKSSSTESSSAKSSSTDSDAPRQ